MDIAIKALSPAINDPTTAVQVLDQIMILVVGATGQLGGTIARRLMAGGHKVRVLVRPAADAGAYGAGGCEVARGDLRDRASLEAACTGIATVVTTANSARRGGGDTVDAVDLNGEQY